MTLEIHVDGGNAFQRKTQVFRHADRLEEDLRDYDGRSEVNEHPMLQRADQSTEKPEIEVA